jgi:N-carbamoylputrescine amidase
MNATQETTKQGPMRLKMAAIQMNALPYEVEKNLRKAESLIEQAVAQGAQVVVLPELFNTGYCYDDRNFQAAEDLSGPTARWFRAIGKRLNIYVAGGMIERSGKEFYDTLILASPQGRLVSYRKRWLALQEKCYFTKGDAPLLVDTPLGRIGIGICADMFDQNVWERFRNKANLLIISSAWPDFTRGGFLFARSAMNAEISRMPRVLPKRLAEALGVPVAYSNLCGSFHSPLPMLYPYHVFSRFVGHSAVYEGGGREIGILAEEEGMVIGEVDARPAPAPGRYAVERGVRFMARLDRLLLTVPCRIYKRLKRTRPQEKVWKKLPQSP